MDWIQVNGILQQGHRVASGLGDSIYPRGTIEMQTPFFLEKGLDLRAYYPGTLNVSIAPYRPQYLKAKYKMEQIHWTDIVPPENFFFYSVRLEWQNQQLEGLIYLPDPATKVVHFQDPSILEILAPPLKEIQYGASLKLWLASDELQLTLPPDV